MANQNVYPYGTGGGLPSGVVIKSCYLSYSSGAMNIFLPANNGLLKYVFEHDVDASKNADIWRIEYVALCNSIGAEMKTITVHGEWEAAILLHNRADFSGGILHGDEVLSNISFFADGQLVNISRDISCLYFNELRILQTSTMYDPNDSTTPIATHTSEHLFTKDGLTINQSLEWLVDTGVTNSYMAMFPVAKAVTSSYCTDKDYTPQAIPSSPNVTIPGVRSINIWSDSARVFCVFGVGNYRGLDDSKMRLLISDNNGDNVYNKCYFYLNDADGTTVNVGDVWKTTTFYKIFAE